MGQEENVSIDDKIVGYDTSTKILIPYQNGQKLKSYLP